MAKDMFHVGTQVLIGKERFSGIFDGMTKVLIVTDKFMHESGTVSYVTDVLDHLKVEWKIFSEVRPDPDIMTVSKGVAMIELPENIIITKAVAVVNTAFNAATTNVLTVGTNDSADDLLGADDVTEGTVGAYQKNLFKIIKGEKPKPQGSFRKIR